jgi:molybdopterin biosynthesis enzyme
MKKEREDSHFWRVDRACAEAMVKVAAGHAQAGGESVVLTGRKLTPEQEGHLSFAGAKAVSTMGER